MATYKSVSLDVARCCSQDLSPWLEELNDGTAVWGTVFAWYMNVDRFVSIEWFCPQNSMQMPV